ncbi:TIP41-like protein [Harpegnathos saltator]|uniref:TIP41-like protein n=1 Tax=Harpegnathos saltator TaxID=610380 RepID=E2BGM5_HARSA|nr:TIP41-like protein [Harpegnathos saltator]XP_011138419.1 TIP41-like protein [Harpegnathos saltator]XP_019696671.1 TIP41-like protein [Harpegnathos saltator]EFN85153.1 TIP41-like protein [Harpegnathos saltator]
MTAVKVHGGIDILRLPVNEEVYVCSPWHIKYTQSHILHSKCSKSENGCSNKDNEACQFCVYNNTLELPHMPDMVFPNNVLTLTHQDGALLQFNALDALRHVSNGKINVQLACAEAWKESRSDSSEYLEEKVKPFDWTFTTDYTGTIFGFKIEETNERIDMDKLRQRDKILFYNDLTLFEDELHDNGIAVNSVKIRVMPSSFFILLRYFLRIDNVMLRINDTRIYHELGKNYLLREFTSREAKVQNIRVSPALFLEPSEIAPHLPLVGSHYHKLIILEKEVSKLNEDTINSRDAEKQGTSASEEKPAESSEHTTDSSIT